MFKKNTISVLISSVTFSIAFFLFYYMDLKSLTVWSLNIWDCLAESGNIRTFYEYSAMNLYRLDHAMVGSDILIYLPWAIWNLPLWILQHFFGLAAIDNFWMMLYSKSFLLAVFALVLYFSRRIAFLFTNEKEDIARMLFLSSSSLFTLTSLAYAGQNDVLVIAPFLIGIYELMRGNRKRFLFWAAVSIAFKPLFIFSFVALVLLKEKNLLKVIGCGIAGCSLYVLQKLLFHGAPRYAESLSYGPMKDIFGLMQKSSLDIPPAGMSLFVLGLGIIWVLAYLHTDTGCTDNSDNNDGAYILYYTVAPFVMFFLFTRYEAYRPFYLVPILYLLFLLRPAYSRINVLLEMAATGSLMYFYLVDDVLFFNPNYLLSLSKFLNKGQEIPAATISSLLAEKLPGFGFQSFTAVFVLAMCMLLIINHPGFHSENEVLKKKEEPWLLPLRSLLYAVPAVLALALRIIY